MMIDPPVMEDEERRSGRRIQEMMRKYLGALCLSPLLSFPEDLMYLFIVFL